MILYLAVFNIIYADLKLFASDRLSIPMGFTDGILMLRKQINKKSWVFYGSKHITLVKAMFDPYYERVGAWRSLVARRFWVP